MSTGMIILIGVLVVLVLWFFGTYNGLISKRNKAEEGFSTMDVYMKKRYDLIPNLVATVKGYAAHEAETLERVTMMRSGATTLSEKIDADAKISQAVKGLMVQMEAYPQLRANENFMDLQSKLNRIEEDIATSRRYYNGCVREYNTSCQQMPANIIAGMFHFQTMKLYEVTHSEERENVKVDFSK